jgi:multiple sugar transport system permease protein
MALPYYVKKRITDIIISIIMLLFLVLTLLPVGWMVFSSLKSSSDIAIGRVGLSRNVAGQVEVHWDNYVDMWKNVNFGLYLKNSLIICGSTMILAMILSTLAAYALSRFKFPGSDFFSNTILATQMIPAIMYLIPLYIMFVKFTVMTGIPVKGTYLGLILIYSAFFVPFSIWILRGFFASIPKELEEAARIDGCSALQVFWYIALPLAMPGIIATGIYLFLQAWDELMFAWVLTNGDTMTIPVGIRLFVGNYQNRFDLMMAAATVATIPVVVLFFMLQKHIVRGLTAGAVKG